MIKQFLTNGFSLNMLNLIIEENGKCSLDIEEISWNEIITVIQKLNMEDGINYSTIDEEIINCFGHESTAQVITELIGIVLKTNRTTVSLKNGNIVYVLQYIGPRLEEGVKILPKGAKIKPLKLTIK